MYTDLQDDNNEVYYEDDNNNKFDKEKLKRIIFFLLVFIVLIIIILLIAKGCSNNKNRIVANNQVPTVVLGRENITLEVGESFTLDADVLLAGNSNTVISWYSEDSGIASVNEQGYITAESEGETTIVALYKESGKEYRNKCNVIVTSKIILPTNINLGQDNVTMKKGENILLQVTVDPSDAKVDKLLWTSADENIASVDEKGYIKAKNVGTTTITVKTSDEKLSDKVNIKVVDNSTSEPTPVTINPTSITLNGLSSGLSVGGDANVLWTISPSNATNKTIKWSSSNTNIATVKNGVVHGVNAGNCTIIATTSNNISARLNITVQSNNVPVTGITISGSSSITMNVGWTKKLSYDISPSNATNKNVTFKSSNTNVIIVDSNGIMAAVGAGSAVVTVKTKDGSKTALANITVKQTSVEGTSTGSSSSGGSSSGSGSSSSSCSVDSVIIKSNQDGAITSNLKFENAKAFTGSNPGLYVTKYDDCLKSVKYSLWYNADKNKLNTGVSPTSTGNFPKQYGTFYLDKGNGYYYIKVDITAKTGETYRKYYYAIVNSSSKRTSGTSTRNNLILSWTKSCSGNQGTFNITATNNTSNITKFSYCFTNNLSGCSSNSYTSIYNNSVGLKSYTKSVINYNNYNLLCMSAISKNGNSYQTCFPNVKCS